MITFKDFPKNNIDENNYFKCINHPNKFYCDLPFYNKLYNKSFTKEQFIKYFQIIGILKGEIINREQLKKFYKNFDETPEFINENINKLTFDQLYKKTIKETRFNFDTKIFETIVLLHIGNQEIGKGLLDKLKPLKDKILLGVTSTQSIKIPPEFKNYFFINLEDLGSDIIPSIILYNQIKKQAITTSNILKLHTKSDPIWRKQLGLKLIRKYDDFIKNGKIAPKKFLNNTNNENFNKFLIPSNKIYVAGTMFLVKEKRFKKILNNKNLLKASLINNYYYDNNFFPDNSPVHSLERLF